MQANEYDLKYSSEDYFNNRKLINDIYVKSIIKKTGIAKNTCILDVGCGQGHFSYLFNKYGMRVLGIDLSKTGVHYAKQHYVGEGLSFAVCNAYAIPVSTKYDCVFLRSFSLYNTQNIDQIRDITKHLFGYLKKDGLFIFCYNVNYSKKKQSDKWRFHGLNDIKQYFSTYKNKKIYFTSKVDCLILGKFAFNKVFSYINIIASKIFGLGGEIVCIIKK